MTRSFSERMGMLILLGWVCGAQAAVGAVGTLADSSGEVVAWGLNQNGQTTVPSGTFTAVDAGNDHSLGIHSDGTLAGWGVFYAITPGAPSGTFTAIAAGSNYSLGLRSDGTLYVWGDNPFGVNNPPSGTFTAVDAGGHSLGIRSNGTLAGWGNDWAGQTTVPSGAFTAIAAGSDHSLGLRSDGTLAGWGSNQYGQTTVPSGTFTAIAAGGRYSLGLRSDGTLTGWGDNSFGPTTVPDGTFTAVAAGLHYGLGLRSDGTLAAWGSNQYGQTTVPSGAFIAVAAGVGHGLAIRARAEYDGDLVISYTGSAVGPNEMKANLNRSIHVSGNAHVESPMYFYNNATMNVDGKVTLAADAKLHNTGAIHTGELEIRTDFTLPDSVAIVADSLRIEKESSSPSLTLNIEKSLEVGGTSTDAVSTNRLELAASTRIQVDGSYRQSEDGELDITLVNSGTTTRIDVLGPGGATLDGVLRVHRQDDFVPVPGDRFRIIEAKSIQGRFKKFEGSVVNDNVFLGLNYKAPGGLLGSTFATYAVDVVAIETPIAVTGGVPRLTNGTNPSTSRNNLLLITHGWNSNANTWASQMAQAVTTQPGIGADWDVVTLDWSQFAGGPPAWDASKNGIDIGESLATWLQETGLDHYQHVHVMGHSAGAWLADAMIDVLSASSSAPTTQLTMFDAFAPGGIRPVGDARPAVLGDTATFAEQYVDMRRLPPYTSTILPNAYNIDVTAQDPCPCNDVSDAPLAHAWPYVWYLLTIAPPNPPHGFGFPLSQEHTGMPPHLTGPRGMMIQLSANNEIDFGLPSYKIKDIDPATSVVSDTGVVDFQQDGSVLMQTGSPVMLTTPITLDEDATLFRFSFEYLNAAPGLLSVYLDGEQVFGLDSTDMASDFAGAFSSGDIFLDTVATVGLHTLLFRLDPLTVTQAGVVLSDIEFGSLQSIPIPIEGDFNFDGVVDAADYVVWRNDPNRTQAQYDIWRTHFGQTPGNGSGSASGQSQLAAVPEPASLWLGLAVAAVLWGRRRRG